MKYLGLGLLIIFAITSVLFAVPDATVDSGNTLGVLEEDGIVARVNDEIITQRELAKMTRLLNIQDRDKIIMIMINERLLYQAAVEAGIEVGSEDVEETLTKNIGRYETTERFEEAILKPLNITLAEYREDMKRQIMREKFIMEKMHSVSLDKSRKTGFYIDTFVTPKEIKKYYEKYKNSFTGEEQIKTRQIILKTRDKSERDSKKTLAEAILAELAKGADFDSLARQYSEVKKDTGGAWDWTPKGSFPEEIEDVIYKLKPGEISPLIETRTNLRIVKVENKRGGANTTFDNFMIQEKIKRIIMNQKVARGAEKLIQELARNARIWPFNILVANETNK